MPPLYFLLFLPGVGQADAIERVKRLLSVIDADAVTVAIYDVDTTL